MPSEKRSHGRITSGNFRPHKSARFRHGTGEIQEDLANNDRDVDVAMGNDQDASPALSDESFDGICSAEHTRMKIAQVVVWPNSLAAVKTQIQYNITPQEGPRLPNHILQTVSKRILRPCSPTNTTGVYPNPPYLHLGFTPFLDLQIYVFLPNLALSNCDYHDPGFVQDSVLERWTDDVLLPSIASNDPRAPTSWRLSTRNKRSPVWYDENLAPFPTYKIYDSIGNHSFTAIWQRIQTNSAKVPDFRHPFLLLFSNGEASEYFYGDRPEEMAREFEMAWHKHIDMQYVSSHEDNLMVDFEYSSAPQIRDLPMR